MSSQALRDGPRTGRSGRTTHHRHQGHEHGRRFARRASRDDDPGHGHDGHDGHGRHGRGRERGEGRSGRLFDHGELRLVMLALISERPRHGYEIIKEIEDRVAGTYSPSPGVIYPTLALLEELAHTTVADGDGRKRHAITPDGAAYLAANRAAVDDALGRMRTAAAGSSGPGPEITRATENLKLALRLRQGRGPLTGDQVRAIAEALDAAAVAIERS